MANPAPISVCMIVRNEHAYLRQCLQKIRPHVAEICIADTGSTDETPDIAKEFADVFVHYDGCNDEENRMVDFSNARNFSFSLARQPWVMWLDGDDELEGAEHLAALLRQGEKLKGMNKRNSQEPIANSQEEISVQFSVNYEHQGPGGQVQLVYPRERIFSPKEAFEWKAPLHEVCVCKSGQLISIPTTGIKTIHRKRESGKVAFEPHRNIRILEYWLNKTGNLEPRMLFYLGREYMESGRLDDAKPILERCVRETHSEPEKGMALSNLADIAIWQEDFDKSIQWGLEWIALQENMPEAYFVVAKAFYMKAHRRNLIRDWQRCAKFADLGFMADMTQKPMFFDPSKRNLEIYMYYIRALGCVGRYDEGLKRVEDCIARYPREPMFQEQKKFFVERLGLGLGLGVCSTPNTPEPAK